VSLRKNIRRIVLESIQEDEWIVYDAKFAYSTYKEVLFVGTKEEAENVIIHNPEMNLEMSIRRSPSVVGEDITQVDNAVKFDYSKEKGKNFNTSLGKSSANIKFSPRVSTLRNSKVKVFSAYSKNTGKEVVEIMKSIKQSADSNLSLDSKDYDHFISRTAIFFLRHLKNESIDSIFVMESSSSLAKDIAFKIKTMLPDTSIKFLENSIIKNIENIKIEKGEGDKFSDQEVALLDRLYNKAKETGEFSIKKIHPKHRRFFTNWIQINRDAIDKITDKNIIVFDDYITSGSTLDEVCRELLKLSPASISSIVLLK